MIANTHAQKPESEQTISAMFDRIAPRYDLLNRLLSFRQDQRWRKHLVDMVPYRPGGTYLDVATGTGDVLIEVAKKRREYANFIGSDISSEMLRLAKQKIKGNEKLANSTIELRKLSAENLEAAPGFCDCLTISFGLRNVVNKQAAINEFNRVLKSDGRLIILEFFKPNHSWAAAMFRFYFHKILPAIGGLISDRDAYRYLPESVEGFNSLPELGKMILDSGFIIESTRRYLFGGCYLIQARKVN